MKPEPSRKDLSPLQADWKLNIAQVLLESNPASGKRKTEDECETWHTLQTKGTLASTAQSSPAAFALSSMSRHLTGDITNRLDACFGLILNSKARRYVMSTMLVSEEWRRIEENLSVIRQYLKCKFPDCAITEESFPNYVASWMVRSGYGYYSW